MAIITKEMRFRERVVKYVKHKNNAKAARKYDTSRQQVQRWRKRYDGNVASLALKSRQPKSHPDQHKQWEIDLIKNRLKRFRYEGMAQVYVECQKKTIKEQFKRKCYFYFKTIVYSFE